ncbi:hypothetical protein RP20_CCG000765 [Aedes albopictus]|nr:hypothetical protein RP20_CCG000765 [Aedes albopictus]
MSISVMQIRTSTAIKMSVTVFAFIVVQIATATTLCSCTFNEFCIDLKQCPEYRPYVNESFKNWPESFQAMAKSKVCNTEKVGNQTVISVCCPSVMNDPTCGAQGDDRISKGEIALPFDYPWMALLNDAALGFVCGGTLISNRYVLTAAHCVKRRNITFVRLGENDIEQIEDCITLDDEIICTPDPQDISIEDRFIHPEYSERNKANDIALLRMASPAIIGDSVKTICLPDGNPEQRKLKPWSFIVSGWGMTEFGSPSNVLRFAKLPAVSLEACSIRVRNLHSSVRLGDGHICAGGVNATDNCRGDSGGPLHYISNDTSRFVQQGIVAFGIRKCGEESEPGVYTNVGQFLSWLIQHVNE